MIVIGNGPFFFLKTKEAKSKHGERKLISFVDLLSYRATEHLTESSNMITFN